jgi:phosphoserine phosphatase RsbU/P
VQTVTQKHHKMKHAEKYIKSTFPTPFWFTSYISWSGVPIVTVYCSIYDDNNKLKLVYCLGLKFKRIIQSMDIGRPVKSFSETIVNKLNGFLFIINKKADILLCPKEKITGIFQLKTDLNFYKDNNHYTNFHIANMLNSKSKTIRNLGNRMINDGHGVQIIKTKNGNNIVAYSTMPSTGWILGYSIPENSLLKTTMQTEKKVEETQKNMGLRFISISIIFLIITITAMTLFFRYLIFKPINRIRSGIRNIGEGDFNIHLKEEGGREISELAASFNYLGCELNKQIKDIKKETASIQSIETEIDIATNMQQAILPKVNGEFINNYFEIEASLDAATDISGDFYDFFYLDEQRIAFLIADVSGKGLQAAFFMGMSKVLIKSLALKHNTDPAIVLEQANNALCMDNKASMFVTVFLIFFDIRTGEFKCANGGHHDSVICNSDETFTLFGSLNEIALGFLPDVKYSQYCNTVKKGESILLYTDGVIEAVSSNNKEYGEKRLINILKKNKNASIKGKIEAVMKDVKRFEDGNRFDDITLLMLKRK